MGISLSRWSQPTGQHLSGICELVKHGQLSHHLPGVRALSAGPYHWVILPLIEGRAGLSWVGGSQVCWGSWGGMRAGLPGAHMTPQWTKKSVQAPPSLFSSCRGISDCG